MSFTKGNKVSGKDNINILWEDWWVMSTNMSKHYDNCTGATHTTQKMHLSISRLAHRKYLLPFISLQKHSPCRVASPTTAPAVASICCLLRATPSYISKYKCSWMMLRTTLCFFSCKCLFRMDSVSLDMRMMNSLDLQHITGTGFILCEICVVGDICPLCAKSIRALLAPGCVCFITEKHISFHLSALQQINYIFN
jgi:hypothetical protein